MQPVHVKPREKSRKWPARISIGVGVIAALLTGVAVGNAANSKQGQISSLDGTISQQRGQIGTLQGKVGTLQDQVSTLQARLSDETNTANHALAAATAKVQAADAAKQARLTQEAATLRAQQAQLNQEIGMVRANQISDDGVYVVGKDIKSGTWHTIGGSQCYYATLGSTDTSNILDNNNFNGPDTVNVSGAFAFQINGGCTWALVGLDGIRSHVSSDERPPPRRPGRTELALTGKVISHRIRGNAGVFPDTDTRRATQTEHTPTRARRLRRGHQQARAAPIRRM